MGSNGNNIQAKLFRIKNLKSLAGALARGSIAFSLLFVLLGGANAFASATLESEFELVLPKQAQQVLLESQWKTMAGRHFTATWNLPDQTVMTPQGVEVHLQGISLQVESLLSQPVLSAGVVTISSTELQAQVLVQKISVDQTITQTLSGITGRFNIHADCNSISLNMTPGAGRFSVILRPQISSSTGSALVQDVNLNWQPNAWAAQKIACSGVQGFEDLVKSEVEKISADASSFVSPRKAELINYVQKYLSQWSFDLSKTRTILLDRPDIQVSMSIDQFSDSTLDSSSAPTESAIAKGRVRIEFARASGIEKFLPLSPASVGDLSQNSQISLRLPQDFIKEVLLRAYAANTWVHDIPSTKLPGFSSIMGSRFLQFFIWPELMKYPKNSAFLFRVYSDENINLKGQGAQYQLAANLLTKMLAPSKNQQPQSAVDFMNFTIPFQSQIHLSVDGGSASLNFSNVDLQLQSQWDPGYVQKNSPSRRFRASIIRSQILNSLEGKNVKFQLPLIPLSESLNLKVNKLEVLSNSDLRLLLAP